MKFAAIATVLTLATFSFAQRKVDPGLYSKHANAGNKSGSLGTGANTPNTAATAAALAKIEQQGVHAPTSAAPRSPAASPGTNAAKVPTPAQAKNKRMGSVRRSQPKANVPR